jgi:hypothetical protein
MRNTWFFTRIASRLREESQKTTGGPLPERWVDLIRELDERERERERNAHDAKARGQEQRKP